MNIKPVASPHQVAPTQSNPQAQAEAKARAMAVLSGKNQQAAQPQQSIVQNQNQVSPEEIAAIQPASSQALAQAAEQATKAAEVNTQTSNEAKKTEEKPQVDPQISKLYAQLAREEKALRAKQQQAEQAIKAREAELASKESQIKAQEQQYKQGYISREELKANTLAILNDMGITYEELTQQALNPVQTDPRLNAQIMELKAQLAEMNAAREADKKAQAEAQDSSYKAALNQIKQDASKLVFTDPEFELVKATNSVQDVVDLIERAYKEDGTLLSVEEAAREVEAYLLEETEKLVQTEKLKKRISAASAKVTETIKKQDTAPTQATTETAQQQPTMKTLTNNVNSTRKLSAKERAMLAFKGQLK